MKRIIMTMTLVLSCSFCSQSYGFDLLDRMLGIDGCCKSNCCDSGCDAPSCCESAPACGCEAPSCGCAEPACGCEDPCSHKGCGLLGNLGCKKNDCCEPACGCEAPAAAKHLLVAVQNQLVAAKILVPAKVADCWAILAARRTIAANQLVVAKHQHVAAKLQHAVANQLLATPAVILVPAKAADCSATSVARRMIAANQLVAAKLQSCGCETASCDSCCDSCGHSRGGLLSKMFSRKSCCNNGCDSCCEAPACGCEAPSCGCETASCDSGCDSCGHSHGGLLNKLFGNLRHKTAWLL